MADRIARFRKIPVPSSYISKGPGDYTPGVYADEHTLIVIYRGMPAGQQIFDPWIMLQSLNYDHFSFKPASRIIKQPALSIQTKGDKYLIRIRFHSAILTVTVTSFRCYGLVEDYDNFDAEDAQIDPNALIGKRAYFERQQDSDVHYPVWDRLLKTGKSREKLWIAIQEKYLFKYQRFLRVECDWGGSGIWGISFPGSYGTTPNYGYDNFDLPKSLIKRFDRWTRYYQSMNPYKPFHEQGFRQEWYDKEGEALASALAARVDTSTYVEYHPFVQAMPVAKQNSGSVHR